MDQFRDPCGVGLFEVAVDGQDANVTQAQLSRVVDEARRLRQVSWCVTVVVVSDDPAFLATFAEWSLKGHLLVWSTRLLAVTHLPLPDLRYIHRTFSRMNAMVVIVEDAPETLKCNVYIHLPYSSPEDRAMRLAFWTPQRGLTLNTHLPLFPDKYSKFLHRPILAVAAEYIHVQKSAQGQKSHMMDYLSQGLNFTYKYVHPADGTFGSEQDDGSWSGMVGMVIREEADFSVGFFSLSASRAEVLDFTWPVSITYSRILAGLGRPELDPWGFLLPLAPLVWAFILVSLLLLPAAMFILSLCCSMKDTDQWVWVTDGFTLLRILLQQG
ncbi:Glutamate receptor ionotropic, kainate 4-like 11 [Homarus americanus]|uniref:Glutamate receptor ionotropic, kainate 4-like 11 n=1 Tax=Homarus americanus TaxID=6706 RepID=A0A8J5TEP0_HOMAM|nr:Glutamate receptor ionotropic, kainate 4-like 11 [Homarus americanus]